MGLAAGHSLAWWRAEGSLVQIQSPRLTTSIRRGPHRAARGNADRFISAHGRVAPHLAALFETHLRPMRRLGETYG